MKKLLRTAVVGAGVASAFLALAQPAWANSFSRSVGDGVISYNDATDKFCVRAYNTKGPRKVTVHVGQNGPGPNLWWKDKNPAAGGTKSATCRSLAAAYEDTKYRVEAFDSKGKLRASVLFYT